MKITLTDSEVRWALAQAISEKVSNVVNPPDADDCWFDVKSPDGDIDDIESVEFSAEFRDES